MATDAQQFTPIELETRPTVDTAAYAHYMHIAPQTARIHACKESGPIRPIRIPGTAKLHWPVAEIKRVLGLQAGFADALILFAIAALAILVQAFAPGLFDLTGIAMLGAGVLGNRESRQYFDLSALAAAAQANGCTVSVGNSNIGEREFSTYTEAMAWILSRAA